MEIFETAYKVLNYVIDQDLSFNIGLLNAFAKTKLDTNQKNDVTALVGCELRHHLVFEELVKRTFGDLSIKSAGGIYLLMANARFIKRFNEDELKEFAKKTMVENGASYDEKTFVEFYENFKSIQNIIPEDFEPGSIEFLSLRYNVPNFLVKMWQKQLGRATTFKLLRANNINPAKTFFVNTLLNTRDEFLKDNHNFAPLESDDMVVYTSKGSHKGLDVYKNKLILPLSCEEKAIIDKLDIDPLKGVAILSNWQNNIYAYLAIKYKEKLKLEVVASSGKDYYSMTNVYRSLGLKNVRFYRANTSSLITCLSKPVNTLFVFPENSHLEFLRTTPDYSLHFKQSSLDNLIKTQMDTLKECDPFVEVDGQIVYMIPTVSSKEGKGLIHTFLNEHKNYSLIDERQYLPLDASNSMLYYAVIKKVSPSSDD